MIAALLALLAAGLLALGYFADVSILGGAALALSALSLGLVGFSTVRRVRDESPEEVVSVVAPMAAPSPVAEVAQPAEDVVLVISGRRRYHRAGCELLNGHEVDELTEDEAREEGFTACSRCATSSE